jgi:sulfoacetaldehyde dehydrogenase
MNYRRHYLNITRVSRPIPEQVPSQEEIFGAFLTRYGAEQCARELGEHRA